MTSAIIAQDLRTGRVVYYKHDSIWTEIFEHASYFNNSKDENDALAYANRTCKDNKVVGVEVIQLSERDGRPSPEKFREVIRATGPTVGSEAKR